MNLRMVNPGGGRAGELSEVEHPAGPGGSALTTASRCSVLGVRTMGPKNRAALIKYRGSAINAHSNDGQDGAPGAAGPSDPAGRSRNPDVPAALENDGSISTHGTR